MRGRWIILLLLAASAAEAAKPDWAKPYLRLPLPQGAYLADAEWVVLYSEMSVGATADGGFHWIGRQVLAPRGGQPRPLTVALDYDAALQQLVAPRVWVWNPADSLYRAVDLKHAAADMPDLTGDVLTSHRVLLITTTPVAPSQRAVVQWEVVDRGRRLGEEDLVVPFGPYPVAEFVVRVRPPAAGAAPVRLLFAEPQEGGPTLVRKGEVVLRELPGAGALHWDDPWLTTPLHTLPQVVVHAGGGTAGPDWSTLAAKEAALYRDALAAQPRDLWAPTAAELTAGAASPGEAAARLAAFVQALAYRDIAWGRGGYQPEPPGETLRSGSADCKGKVALLQALLAEAGVDSVPVLCSVRPGHQGEPPIPTLGAFDHVVLAVRLPGGEGWPGALTGGGPGDGWVLFDPTDPLATFGLPAADLEGSWALWLSPQGGELFPVRTREPGCLRVEAALEVRPAVAGEAEFELTLAGHSPLIAVAQSLHPADPERLRQLWQAALQGTAPGTTLTAADFQPPDHLRRLPARLVLRGTVPEPLRSVGGDLFTLAWPGALIGEALGVPVAGDRPAAGVKAPGEPAWLPWAEPRFQAEAHCLRGEISLSLPDGWSVVGQPELRSVDRPWLVAETAAGPPWTLTADLARGRFAAGSADRRLADLGELAALFRRPFLLRTTGR